MVTLSMCGDSKMILVEATSSNSSPEKRLNLDKVVTDSRTSVQMRSTGPFSQNQYAVFASFVCLELRTSKSIKFHSL